jgi:hypothetical protein
VNDVFEFLTELFDKGLGYNSINCARAALSSLGIRLANFSAGNHPLVSRFLRGVYNIRPVKPRYSEIWDVNYVLVYLRTLSPVKELSLKDLTLKLVMLMGLTNATRVQTLHLLSVKNLKKLKFQFVVSVEGLLKQSRPSFNVSFFKVYSLPARQAVMCVFCIKRIFREN